MHILVDDDLGRLVLRRVWPWHLMLACSRAGQLDRELAAGTSPEASVVLAARAARLTSTEFRRDLAASLRRMLAAAGQPVRAVAAQRPGLGGARPPRVPVRTLRISQTAPRLAELASRLLEPGPVPVRGVAMVTLLLTDGTGPLYREASRADLGVIADRAALALIW